MVFECVEHVMLLCDMNQRIQSDSLSSTKTRVNWFLARPSWSCAVYEPSSSGDSWSNRISTRPSALLNLIWRCCRRQRIFIFLTDFSLLQRVLDPIPAAYGWRQGTALNESPAYCRALCEYWGFGALLKGTVEGVFAPLPATRTLSSFALGAPCLSAQPPPYRLSYRSPILLLFYFNPQPCDVIIYKWRGICTIQTPQWFLGKSGCAPSHTGKQDIYHDATENTEQRLCCSVCFPLCQHIFLVYGSITVMALLIIFSPMT